jgi:hypothetical protein
MKYLLSISVFMALLPITALAQQLASPSPAVVHIATALNHLTVLEFYEPVTMAAAGSSDFQIERESNKVFVKPIKSGAATDLFVWTASRRYAYELEITQEVKNMNVAIDNAPVVSPPKPVVDSDADQIADVVLTRAFLGAEAIKQSRGRKKRRQVNVFVEQVFRTQTTVYVHYTLENNSELFYRAKPPQAYQLKVDDPLLLGRLAHTQLDQNSFEEFGDSGGEPLPMGHAEEEVKELHPGETTEGVVSIRQSLPSRAVVQLVFGDGVKAIFVL